MKAKLRIQGDSLRNERANFEVQQCAFHQGAPENNVENCYPLKTEVQKLVKSGILSFKDVGPNVKDNSLPKHGRENVVNMVAGCPGDFQIFYINLVRGDLVKMHADLCEFSYYTQIKDKNNNIYKKRIIIIMIIINNSKN